MALFMRPLLVPLLMMLILHLPFMQAEHKFSLGCKPSASSLKCWEEIGMLLLEAGLLPEMLTNINDYAHKHNPTTLSPGLDPLVSTFQARFKETKVAELEAILKVFKRLPPSLQKEVSLEDLVSFNLLAELSFLFQRDLGEGPFGDPEVNLFKVNAAGEEIMVNFGYVGERNGQMIKDLLHLEKGTSEQLHYFLARSYEAMLAQELHQKPLPPFDQNETKNSSKCIETSTQIICSHKKGVLNTGIWIRNVLWEVPDGTPPPNGWPVVLHFQGSFFAPHLFSWNGATWMPFGAYEQTRTIKLLLDAGYAVITPETHWNGFTFWDTNIPPYSLLWETAPDHFFMKAILDEIKNPNGLFGRLDSKRKFATGISSGGYMTSRMAVSYEGEFLALAVCSASYATCGGPACLVPFLPKSHPPTLFLHGVLDPVVPLYTMEMYYTALVLNGTPTKQFLGPLEFHEWVDGSAEEVLRWFQSFDQV